MALDKAALKSDIIAIITDMEGRYVDAKEEYATRLSDAIESYVKSGKVAIGITVTTTGTAAAQTGKTTTEGSII